MLKRAHASRQKMANDAAFQIGSTKLNFPQLVSFNIENNLIDQTTTPQSAIKGKLSDVKNTKT